MSHALITAVAAHDVTSARAVLDAMTREQRVTALNQPYPDSYLKDLSLEGKLAAVLPLYLAVDSKDMAMVSLLLENGADPSIVTHEETPFEEHALQLAVKSRGSSNLPTELQLIDLLCQYGALLDNSLLEDCTFSAVEFHASGNISALQNCKSIISRLVQHYLMCELHSGIRSYTADEVKQMFNRVVRIEHPYVTNEPFAIVYPDVNFDSGVHGGLPVVAAAGQEDSATLQWLIAEKNANPISHQELDGYNVLHEAARLNRTDTIEWLLDDCTQLTNTEKTSLINSREFNQGYTPLHIAAQNNNFDAVEHMLTYNADPTLTTNRGIKASLLTSDPAIRNLLLSEENTLEVPPLMFSPSSSDTEGSTADPAFASHRKR